MGEAAIGRDLKRMPEGMGGEGGSRDFKDQVSLKNGGKVQSVGREIEVLTELWK